MARDVPRGSALFAQLFKRAVPRKYYTSSPVFKISVSVLYEARVARRCTHRRALPPLPLPSIINTEEKHFVTRFSLYEFTLVCSLFSPLAVNLEHWYDDGFFT